MIKLAGICAAMAGLASPATASGVTEQRRFVARENGEPTLPVSGRRNGDCDTSSYKSARDDAWRCISGNFITTHRPHSGLNYCTPAEVAQTWDDALRTTNPSGLNRPHR